MEVADERAEHPSAEPPVAARPTTLLTASVLPKVVVIAAGSAVAHVEAEIEVDAAVAIAAEYSVVEIVGDAAVVIEVDVVERNAAADEVDSSRSD